MLLSLLSQKPFPVGSLLSLFQSKLNAPRPHLVLGCLRIHLSVNELNPHPTLKDPPPHLFQELHVELKSCFVSAPSSFKEKRVFLHLDEKDHTNCWNVQLRSTKMGRVGKMLKMRLDNAYMYDYMVIERLQGTLDKHFNKVSQQVWLSLITLISGLATSDTLMVRKMIFGLWAQETLGVNAVWAAIILVPKFISERGHNL